MENTGTELLRLAAIGAFKTISPFIGHFWPFIVFVLFLKALKALLRDGDVLSDILSRRRVRAAKRIEDVLENSPTDFEHLCAELFRAKGYTVKRTGGCGDGGVDLAARREDELVVVQCKRFREKPVGVNLVRELLGAMTAERADHGYLLTTSRFTRDAQDFARGRNLTLVDRRALVKEIRHYLPDVLPQEPDAFPQPVPASSTEAASGAATAWDITCAVCGRSDTVPFRPRGDKPLLCRECYRNRFSRQ